MKLTSGVTFFILTFRGNRLIVFSSGKPEQPSLMFERNAGAYPSEVPFSLSSWHAVGLAFTH
jgi:hypothetical protein